MKFRWTRELLAEHKKRKLSRRLPDGPAYETMAEYWERMRRRRAARAALSVQVAAEFDALPRPAKPPARKATP